MSIREFDVQKARLETPACQKIIHFNNAGASLMPEPVVNTLINHLKLEANLGGYEAAAKVKDRIESVYNTIATLINAKREEIAVIENATRAWDMAFYSIPFRAGDRILTARAEYSSNYLAYLQLARKLGIEIRVIPNDEHGQVSIDALEQMIDSDVKLISISHIPTNGGLVNPATEIGRIASDHDILYLLDACQSVGQMPVDVQKIRCDMLSATGRKYLRGPRGTGFLYMRQELVKQLEPPFIDLHAARWVSKDEYRIRPDARRFENWESFIAGKLGLAEAVSYAMQWGLENIWQRIKKLGEKLRGNLTGLPGIEIQDIGLVKCGIVTFTVRGKEAETVKKALNERGINVSTSTRESTLLDMESRSLDSVIRASVHYYNTEGEIERFCSIVEALT
ncbi:MAG: aminotransferase class V-fold PLP-dependent enzyme [Candidatus Odinarchaeota archaeon]